MADQAPRSHAVISSKRRKTAIACKNCRDRKTRCDGARPVCSTCQKRHTGTSCVYHENFSGSSRAYITALEDQLKRLEAPGLVDQQEQGGHQFSVTNPALAQGGASATSFMSSAQPTTSQQLPQTPDSNLGDAMATLSTSYGDGAFYGESSSIAFVRRIAFTTPQDQPASDTPEFDKSTCSLQSLNALDAIRETDESAAVYPLRRVANDFLRCFWEYVHPVFPILHKLSFVATYERFWVSQTGNELEPNPHEVEDTVFSSTMNLVFALGCRYSSHVPALKKTAMAEEFYRRSKNLFIFDLLDSLSFPLVQLLLLQGIYLQFTTHVSRCWNVTGLAIRSAQGLGLHLDQGAKPYESQLHREMRRRVWYTCVVLDALGAATFGRPTMIDGSWNVKLPELVDDEYLQTEGQGTQPPGLPSQLEMFLYSVKLFAILKDILATLYSSTTVGKPKVKVEAGFQPHHRTLISIMELSSRLDTSLASVPAQLKTTLTRTYMLESAGPDASYVHENALSCRFLYTRTLLLRPLLLLAIENKDNMQAADYMSILDQELFRHAANLCITTASHLIDSIHLNLTSPYRIADWHCVYLTFTAATTLLAGFKSSVIDITLLGTSFEISWGHCLTILQYFEGQVEIASRAALRLQHLKDQVIPIVPCSNQTTTPAIESSSALASLYDVEPQQTAYLPSMTTTELDAFMSDQAGWHNNPGAWFGEQMFLGEWSE